MFLRWRKSREHELERELRSHLELEAEEQQEVGVLPQEACYAAQQLLGNATSIKEEVREMWGWRWLERSKQDLGYAVRTLSRSPGFTILVVLTLTLGIGANTAIFSILNAVLLQPLPYRDPSRLVVIWDREIHVKGTSKLFDLYSDYENWKKNSHSFATVAAFSWAPGASPSKILTGIGSARSVFTLPVTPDFFQLLGVPAMLGRTFNDSDAGRGCAVVLANDFWRTTLAGQKSVIGKSLHLDDHVCTIFGVMPSGFAFLPPEERVSMWTLIPPPVRPDDFAVGVFARLRPNTSLTAAQTEVSLLHREIHKHDLWGEKVEPVIYGLHAEFTWLTGRNLRATLFVLFGVVNFVLLICCVNVANLLLGRAVAREREMAIRAAMGSGRYRLLRQLLTENLLLSAIASVFGIVLAWSIVHYFRVQHPIEIPPATSLGVSGEVLAFAASLSVITALLFGLVPAWRASRVSLDEVLKAAGRTSSPSSRQQRFGKGLVVAEVMLTMILLSAAGLLIQALNRFASAPLGFQPDGLVTASISFLHGVDATPEQRIQLYERLRTGLAALAGVQDITFTSAKPIAGGGATDVVEVEGHPEPQFQKALDTYQHTVSSDYFRTMKIPLLAGRFFDRRDSNRNQPVAIVNEALVRKYLRDEDPVGKYVRPFSHKGPWFKVVGVVGNEKRTTVYQEMAWAASPVIYRPLDQNPFAASNVIVRASGNGRAIAASLQRIIGAIDPDIPVEEVQTVRDLESKHLAYPRFRATLVGAFAGLALILAVVGLFGILSQLVAQRTHEIGVRMALGAQRRDVLGLVIWQGAALTGGGLVAGLAAAFELTKLLRGLLYGVQASDPWMLAGLSILLIAVAVLAAYIPARRAASIDPMVALRYE